MDGFLVRNMGEIVVSMAERLDYVALDLLNGNSAHSNRYTPADKQRFEQYLEQRIGLIDLPQKDIPFLRGKMLAMYANPVINKEEAEG